MKSLSALCHALDVDLNVLADRADLPTDLVQSWASSDDLPGLKDLRDIAVVLGTSVSNLLAMDVRDIRPTVDRLAGPSVDKLFIDPFWGYLGIEGVDGTKAYYPISDDTAREIEDEIRDGDSPFSIHTLNHRILVLSPRNLTSVRLIEADEDGEAIQEHTAENDTVYPVVNAEVASAMPVIACLELDKAELLDILAYPADGHREWAQKNDTEALRIRLDQAMEYSVSDLFKFKALRQYAEAFGDRAIDQTRDLTSAHVQRNGGRSEVLKFIDAESVRDLVEDLDREWSGAYSLSYGRKSKQTVHYGADDIAAIDIPLSLLHTLMTPEIYREQVAALKQMKTIDDAAQKWFLASSQSQGETSDEPVRTRPRLVVVK